MCFVGRITQDLKAIRDSSSSAIGRYNGNLPRRLIFKAMEGALDMVSDYLAFAQLNTPVGTFVAKTVHFPAAISPEDKFLSHPDNAHWFISNLG
jgi:hypothetical protein